MKTELEIDAIKKQIEFADYCITLLQDSKIKKAEIEKTEEHKEQLQTYLEKLQAKLKEEQLEAEKEQNDEE